jgi:DNA-binding NtrC family response regulator
MSTANITPTRTLRVLIVEDEQRLRDLLVDVLPGMGFPATGVRSAEEATRLMETSPCDIALLDLQLPVMGGMDFFARLRQRWPATQVIVLTGFGDLEAARRAIRLDVVDFLSKPCPLREIELALERARRRIHGIDRGEIGAALPSRAPSDAENKSEDAATLWEVERRQILSAIERNDGNRTAAAAELGISRRTLHYRLSEYRRMGRSSD